MLSWACVHVCKQDCNDPVQYWTVCGQLLGDGTAGSRVGKGRKHHRCGNIKPLATAGIATVCRCLLPAQLDFFHIPSPRLYYYFLRSLCMCVCMCCCTSMYMCICMCVWMWMWMWILLFINTSGIVSCLRQSQS